METALSSTGPASPLAVAGPATPAASLSGVSSRREYIRGSSLLLVGRFISVVLNFGVQVLTVRYLAKGEYGAFAYGIGVATLGTSIVLVGLAKGIPRLVPIYHERRDDARTVGSVVLAAGTICGLGLLLIVIVYALQGMIARHGHLEPLSLSLLLVLVALAPLDALDNLLQQLVAVFCSPRAIFLRRQVLGPGLKLAAILAVTLVGGNVHLLAYGYLIGSVIGVSLYVVTLGREWKKLGLLEYLRPGRIRLPVRELFGFSLPLLSTDLSVAVRGSLVIVMLEYFRTTSSVAEYRAVLPVAGLNMVVFEAFAFLFVPLASRMFARNNRDGIGELYWQTSLWIALLTLPVFLATCLLAPALTVLLFGARYAEAGTLLAILSIGNYFNAALGFNAATLRVHGKIRIIVASDILTALVSLVLGFVLIRRYGALGAAISTTATLVLQNVFNHAGLWLGDTGIRLLTWRFVRVYLLIAVVSAALAAVQVLVRPPEALTVLLAAAVCAAVVWLSRHSIDPADTFPELLRVPWLRRVLVRER